MSEVSKSLEGVNENYVPSYDPDSPAPEQKETAEENAARVVLSIMNEVRENVTGLSLEQYGEIQRSFYHGVEAILQSNQDVYGEPKEIQENEAEKAFGPSSVEADVNTNPSNNPYENQFI